MRRPFSSGTFDYITKALGVTSVLGIIVGGACFFWYAASVNHFPRDLSAGDTVVFLLVAACFGIVYAFLVGSLLALGITSSPLFRPGLERIGRAIKKFGKRPRELIHELAPFDWSAAPYSAFALFLILALGQKNPTAYWMLPLVSVALYIFYSLYRSCDAKLRSLIRIGNQAEPHYNVADLKSLRLVSVLMIVLVPLVLAGVTGQVITGAMRMATFRIDAATVYVREPYAALLPPPSDETIKPIGEYKAFKMDVVLNGVGKSTIVEFPLASGGRQTLEVPNEFIIVLPPPKRER